MARVSEELPSFLKAEKLSLGMAYGHLIGSIWTAWDNGVSDVHFMPGCAPVYRRGLKSVALEKLRVGFEELKAPVSAASFVELRSYWEAKGQWPKGVDHGFQVSIDHDKYWRARVEVVPVTYVNGVVCDSYGLEIRILPHTPFAFGDLGYPPEFLDELCRCPGGVVLVGGLPSSGRSTTLASLVLKLSHEMTGLRIGTLEYPIEYILRQQSLGRGSQVVQVQAGSDAGGWRKQVASLQRRDFNVVMFSDIFPILPDGQALDISGDALRLAGNGVRVLACVPGSDFWAVFEKFTWRSDVTERWAMREMAVQHLRGIMVQQLVPVTMPDGDVVMHLHSGCMLFSWSLRDQLRKLIWGRDESGVRRALESFNRDRSIMGCKSFEQSKRALQERGVSASGMFLGLGSLD
jgi:Tfp pilus assembly pilus retraction ATPase PilT